MYNLSLHFFLFHPSGLKRSLFHSIDERISCLNHRNSAWSLLFFFIPPVGSCIFVFRTMNWDSPLCRLQLQLPWGFWISDPMSMPDSPRLSIFTERVIEIFSPWNHLLQFDSPPCSYAMRIHPCCFSTSFNCFLNSAFQTAQKNRSNSGCFYARLA